MRTATVFALLVFLSRVVPSIAGTALTENFSVIAPSDQLAERVAKQAEAFRKQAAVEWFGRELPAGKGATLITVIVSDKESDAMTWPIDSPQRKFHKIWITASAEQAAGTLLQHEVLHTVQDTFTHPDFLVPWASEGVASQVDDSDRKAARRQRAARWASDGNWPQLDALFHATKVAHTDYEGYATAASVVEFLVAQGGKPKVVEFALAGKSGNWDRAAHDCYGMSGVAELQARWQTWVSRNVTAPPNTTSP